MKLRTLTLIWWAVLMLGAVAWCRAQNFSGIGEIDSTEAIRIVRMDPPVTYPVIKPDIEHDTGKPYREIFRLDSNGVITITDHELKAFISVLPLLWDEYKSWCDSDSGWIKFQSLAKCRELGYTVEDCGWHIKIYRKADIEGFMHFIRRKAGE